MDEPQCLIVDDEPAIRAYISLLLRRGGIQSLEAENAVEALRILDKHGDQIDLLISDVQMPGDMNGLELAYSVKDLYSSVKVILISGTAQDAPDGFALVRKPFKMDQILNVIDKVMSGSAGGAR